MIEKLQENPNAGALSWLLEMELVTTPYVLNSLIMNVFKSVPGIKDAQFVIDVKSKKLLVYLELSKFSEWFRKRKTIDLVDDMLEQVLPNFKRRIIFEKAILEKAIAIVQRREQTT